MELYQEMLLKFLGGQKAEITFPQLNIEPEKILELQSYAALQKIKAIIEDDSQEDEECFMKIEQIVCLFEDLGSNGGTRHDFG